eukprot:TRINITY_DN13528_c0_g2_i1.p1 TRINITY_DN13528_c0_g2~~TRINITY_DN13528_c0_g2_i1.p1  ORF type:complete len:612 (+),score=164.62 TRINITY_DN13528_c0_g2_i1:58-1893(+)
MTILIVLLLFIIIGVVFYVGMKPLMASKEKNIFPDIPSPKELHVEEDLEARDRVLKQLYTKANTPDNLDVIVIGSGIGGMATAAILSKMGKKVLVVDQHDTAGGCCHTFFEKEFEFDSGIHYIGKDSSASVINLLTDGKQKWHPMDEAYDVCCIGDKKINMMSNPKAYKEELLKAFPDEERAIDKYLAKLHQLRDMKGAFIVKILPKWFLTILRSTGLLKLLIGNYFELASQTTQSVLDSITDNKELQAVLGYCYADYGTIPAEGAFGMHALVVNHYRYGAQYPVGGSSEMIYHLIKVVESAGGRVLCKARVAEVVVENNTAVGVRMDKDDAVLRAPIIVSDAGYYNTYAKLAPQLAPHLEKKPFTNLRRGMSCVCLFVGLDGSPEELGLKAQNFWIFKDEKHNENSREYEKMTEDDALSGDWEFPVMFLSFPIQKDPIAKKRLPGKSTCTIVAPASYELFQGWENERIHNRGSDYEALKNAFADKMWKTTLKHFPQLEGKDLHIEASTPLSCKYYLNSGKGEIYGIDHTAERFSYETMSSLRPETPLKGLWLTGQDILTAGFGGALMGGFFSASAITGRNIMLDLQKLEKKGRAARAAARKKEEAAKKDQ